MTQPTSPRLEASAADKTARCRLAETAFLVAGLIYLLADYFLTALPFYFPQLQVPNSQWNWSGKLIGIAFAISLVGTIPWLRRNSGYRWQQAPGSRPISIACFLICLTAGISLGLWRPRHHFSTEEVLVQLTMPSLSEELACRGIALALFERAFGQSPMSCSLRFGWASALLSVLFGLGHGLVFEQGSLRFYLLPFLVPTLYGAIFALARTRSGSLVWPVLCHSAANVPYALIQLFR